jgi:hypothetical protein
MCRLPIAFRPQEKKSKAFLRGNTILTFLFLVENGEVWSFPEDNKPLRCLLTYNIQYYVEFQPDSRNTAP